jgi:predicted RNA-binding protein with PIN domain
MAGRQVLIDGYNVIRADPVLSGLEARSLEEARDQLTRAVASWPRFRDDDVTIVFDGSRGRSFASTRRFGHVTVTFSASASADDVIKSLAARSRDPARIIVVTNDADIRQFCSALGCSVTGSQNLLDQLGSPWKRRGQRPREDFSNPPSPGSEKKGNPQRLPKRLRGRRDVRF